MVRFKFRVSMKPTLQDIHALSFNSSNFIVKDIQTRCISPYIKVGMKHYESLKVVIFSGNKEILDKEKLIDRIFRWKNL